MNLKPLNLKNHLIKMGMPILQEIIGREELEAISLITNKSINETMIAELLIKSNGEEIFSDPLLRGYVIHFLPENYKSYLEFNDENKLVEESLEKKIINRAWNRNFQSHFRLIEIFNLSYEYLPEETTPDNNSFILRINNSSDKKSFFAFLIDKFIKYFKSLFLKKNIEILFIKKIKFFIRDIHQNNFFYN